MILSLDCLSGLCNHDVVGNETGDPLTLLLISATGCDLMQTDLSEGGSPSSCRA